MDNGEAADAPAARPLPERSDNAPPASGGRDRAAWHRPSMWGANLFLVDSILGIQRRINGDLDPLPLQLEDVRRSCPDPNCPKRTTRASALDSSSGNIGRLG